jgi:DNA-binding NarL/FixJ family response regulator
MVPSDHELLQMLAPMEREAVRSVAMGLSEKEAAKVRGVSPSTVKNQRNKAMVKLGLHDIASVTRFAIRVGLIQA